MRATTTWVSPLHVRLLLQSIEDYLGAMPLTAEAEYAPATSPDPRAWRVRYHLAWAPARTG